MTDLQEKRALYPRVSAIIAKQNDEFKNIPLETLANACLRGEKVHNYCAAWTRGLWVDDIEPEYKPYFDAFVEWANENIEDLIYPSTRLYDDIKLFTGEFDMIVKLKGSNKRVLMDIKTSNIKSKTWPVQLSAYDHLCKINGYEVDMIMNLHLKKTHAAIYQEKEGEKVLISPLQVKTAQIMHEDIAPYWEIFSSALACYDYFDRKEVK